MLNLKYVKGSRRKELSQFAWREQGEYMLGVLTEIRKGNSQIQVRSNTAWANFTGQCALNILCILRKRHDKWKLWKRTYSHHNSNELSRLNMKVSYTTNTVREPSILPTFWGIEDVAWSAQRIPTAVYLGFLDRSRYFLEIAPHITRLCTPFQTHLH
jgi:hypothetical protein